MIMVHNRLNKDIGVDVEGGKRNRLKKLNKEDNKMNWFLIVDWFVPVFQLIVTIQKVNK